MRMEVPVARQLTVRRSRHKGAPMQDNHDVHFCCVAGWSCYEVLRPGGGIVMRRWGTHGDPNRRHVRRAPRDFGVSTRANLRLDWRARPKELLAQGCLPKPLLPVQRSDPMPAATPPPIPTPAEASSPP